jgi:hypothetical protein
MEPLVFKIETQADDSGVRKYEKSLDGVNVSSRKASGALKSFVQDIAQARDGTDVASAALGAFSRVLGSSLAGTGIIIAGKALIDAFAKIDEAVKQSEMAVSEAFAGMDKAGKAMSFAEATGQAKNFEGVAENIRKKIKEINDSPFTSIIDNITQSTKLMDIQATIAENQAREIKRVGAESELAHLKKMQGLDAENKALELNSRALEKELDGIDAIKESETALAITRKYQMQADEIRSKFADERSKQESENADKRQKEIEAQIKAEKELAEAQQKRFNDLYDAEIKAQEATQKRIDANNKAEEEAQKKTDELKENKKEQEKTVGAGGLDLAGRGAGQRETSFQRGLRENIPRAQEQGRREAREAVNKDIGRQLKAEGKPSGAQDIQREISRRTLESERLASQLEVPGFKELKQASLDRANQAIAETKRIDDMAKEASNFSTNLSNLKTPFDQAMKSADNFSNGMLESGGNMVENFLKGGDSASNLGNSLDDAAESAKNMSEEIKKSGPRGGKSGGGGGGGADGGDKGSLSSIEKLLQKNFDELKAYAHAT